MFWNEPTKVNLIFESKEKAESFKAMLSRSNVRTNNITIRKRPPLKDGKALWVNKDYVVYITLFAFGDNIELNQLIKSNNVEIKGKL